ncbi:hypothetical protein [Paraburkholderia hospita]|uniref:hypothetical protein n=1 Tax=Paraburkholderia hospita TaxID=169430 RepID=UPI001F61FFE0|nr:hypothetical protein [Paraburkholderia hospita]
MFPSPRGKVAKRHDTHRVTGRVATAHGFLSSFGVWTSEQGCARDLGERALAHTVANKVEAAYHRTDLMEQRRPMMQRWAAHVRGVNEWFQSLTALLGCLKDKN